MFWKNNPRLRVTIFLMGSLMVSLAQAKYHWSYRKALAAGALSGFIMGTYWGLEDERIARAKGETK